MKRIKSTVYEEKVYCGKSLFKDEYYEIPIEQILIFLSCEELKNDISNGIIIVNNGENDLSAEEGLAYFLTLSL